MTICSLSSILSISYQKKIVGRQIQGLEIKSLNSNFGFVSDVPWLEQ